jgi:hypothetical protein
MTQEAAIGALHGNPVSDIVAPQNGPPTPAFGREFACRAQDVLEHLPRTATAGALREWSRPRPLRGMHRWQRLSMGARYRMTGEWRA